ncbi:hypothetical protein A7C99_3434 [Trichophyton rubrum]|uniref:Uncharacterized protein n=1 Tax=Trichophyton rubrum TaxID=5551 RepID=A0A178EYY0_TRIRU|nr:hypothetical protein A7C99_3434 [Trichophyton rubrum]
MKLGPSSPQVAKRTRQVPASALHRRISYVTPFYSAHGCEWLAVGIRDFNVDQLGHLYRPRMHQTASCVSQQAGYPTQAGNCAARTAPPQGRPGVLVLRTHRLQLTRLAGAIGSLVGIPGMDGAGGLRAAWLLSDAGGLARWCAPEFPARHSALDICHSAVGDRDSCGRPHATNSPCGLYRGRWSPFGGQDQGLKELRTGLQPDQ